MLFSSVIFVYVFLPCALISFYLLAKISRKAATFALISASIIFYGYFNAYYLFLLAASISLNYSCALFVGRGGKAAHTVLVLGVSANLLTLAYFKYYNFFIENINSIFNLGFVEVSLVLPLAISFFTFQQIAYLVDTYRDGHSGDSFSEYALFVVFFAQLIAGPIVHWKEVIPQFRDAAFGRFESRFFSAGLCLFSIGLFKKVVLADNIGIYADLIFSSVSEHGLTTIEAWSGLLAYTLQIYLDFSAYSNMAVGLGLLVGIRLPRNFDYPYLRASLIEFWHRWHQTLSQFLKDYVYIPLGGNRHGVGRKYLNLLATMGLGGLWHGAGWTFVLWGLLHGLGLILNHEFRRRKHSMPPMMFVQQDLAFLRF